MSSEPVTAEDLVGHRTVRERVRPVPIQTGENWWFPQGTANAIAAGASDLAMVDIMKIGGVTGWMAAMAQAEAAALPLSNHTFVEPSAHVMAVAPTASWFWTLAEQVGSDQGGADRDPEPAARPIYVRVAPSVWVPGQSKWLGYHADATIPF
jgi:L-alanine-DL-glutamate epimerase-like enolase superfamily enzyme